MKNTDSPLRVDPEDQADHDLGNAIAKVLQLSRNKAGWFNTEWGHKTPCGLARTVRVILENGTTTNYEQKSGLKP